MSSVWEDTSTSVFDGAAIYRPVIDDDESNVKDNWDDEDETPPAPAAAPAAGAKPAAKPKAKDKKKLEKEPVQILTPDEIAAQKAEAEKRVRDADLELAKEMLGTKISISDVSFTPSTPEQFENLNVYLVNLISSLSGSKHFPEFAEKFTRELAVSLDTDILKKMSDVLSAVLAEKTKQSLQLKKTKKSAKGIKLRVGDPLRETGDDEMLGVAAEEMEEEYDEVADKFDFM